eukprot:Tbor_TRINITY_DN5532_c0_g1::TRINITY_DN5532_c0_g1_i1::g.13928::m.13928
MANPTSSQISCDDESSKSPLQDSESAVRITTTDVPRVDPLKDAVDDHYKQQDLNSNLKEVPYNCQETLSVSVSVPSDTCSLSLHSDNPLLKDFLFNEGKTSISGVPVKMSDITKVKSKEVSDENLSHINRHRLSPERSKNVMKPISHVSSQLPINKFELKQKVISQLCNNGKRFYELVLRHHNYHSNKHGEDYKNRMMSQMKTDSQRQAIGRCPSISMPCETIIQVFFDVDPSVGVPLLKKATPIHLHTIYEMGSPEEQVERLKSLCLSCLNPLNSNVHRLAKELIMVDDNDTVITPSISGDALMEADKELKGTSEDIHHEFVAWVTINFAGESEVSYDEPLEAFDFYMVIDGGKQQDFPVWEGSFPKGSHCIEGTPEGVNSTHYNQLTLKSPIMDLNTRSGQMLLAAERILKELQLRYFIPQEESKNPKSEQTSSASEAILSQAGVVQALMDFSILCQKSLAHLHHDLQEAKGKVSEIYSNTEAMMQITDETEREELKRGKKGIVDKDHSITFNTLKYMTKELAYAQSRLAILEQNEAEFDKQLLREANKSSNTVISEEGTQTESCPQVDILVRNAKAEKGIETIDKERNKVESLNSSGYKHNDISVYSDLTPLYQNINSTNTISEHTQRAKGPVSPQEDFISGSYDVASGVQYSIDVNIDKEAISNSRRRQIISPKHSVSNPRSELYINEQGLYHDGANILGHNCHHKHSLVKTSHRLQSPGLEGDISVHTAQGDISSHNIETYTHCMEIETEIEFGDNVPNEMSLVFAVDEDNQEDGARDVSQRYMLPEENGFYHSSSHMPIMSPSFSNTYTHKYDGVTGNTIVVDGSIEICPPYDIDRVNKAHSEERVSFNSGRIRTRENDPLSGDDYITDTDPKRSDTSIYSNTNLERVSEFSINSGKVTSSNNNISSIETRRISSNIPSKPSDQQRIQDDMPYDSPNNNRVHSIHNQTLGYCKEGEGETNKTAFDSVEPISPSFRHPNQQQQQHPNHYVVTSDTNQDLSLCDYLVGFTNEHDSPNPTISYHGRSFSNSVPSAPRGKYDIEEPQSVTTQIFLEGSAGADVIVALHAHQRASINRKREALYDRQRGPHVPVKYPGGGVY